MRIKSKDLYWLKSGFFSILQNLFSVLLSFGSFYLLVRLLSENNFGAWTLFMSTVTILEIVRGGLIQNALIMYLASADVKEHPKIISSSFAITVLLTLFCIILNFCFAGYLGKMWKSPDLIPVFYLYNIAFIFSGILTQFNCIEQANLKFKGIFVSSFIRQIAFFGYVAFCYIGNIKLELLHLVYLQIITTFLGMVISYFYARPYLIFSFKIYPEWLKKLFNYGKYAFGTSVSSILSGTIDQMMLGVMLSPAASGAFNIAVRIINLIDIPTNAIAVIVFPQSAKRIETEGKEAIKYLYEKSVGTLLAILVPAVLFMFTFSNFVVHFIAGSKYMTEGSKYQYIVPLLHVTLLYALLIPYGRQFGTILDSTGKTKLNFFIVVFTATMNIVLNYPLIKAFGVMGAAYASLCSNIVGFTIAQIILKKDFNVSLGNTVVYALRFYPEFYYKYINPPKHNAEQETE